MKNLLACLAILAAFTAGAQSTMPYNPDANDDSYIGATDILGVLPLYGQQFGIDSSLTCDYDGTPFEDWVGLVWNGGIIVDSILVQYHIIDSAQVYMAGCPAPVWEVASYERAWMTTSYLVQPTEMWWKSTHLGYNRYFSMRFFATTGVYQFSISDAEIGNTDLYEIFGGGGGFAVENGSTNWQMPFDSNFVSIDESGLHFAQWSSAFAQASYLSILPFWHYAE